MTDAEKQQAVEEAEHQDIEAWLDDYVRRARETHRVELKTPTPDTNGTNWKELNDREFPRA